MSAVFTPLVVGARRGPQIVSISGPLHWARRTASHEGPFDVITVRPLAGPTVRSRVARASGVELDEIERERARRPAVRGCGPVGGSGKEPA